MFANRIPQLNHTALFFMMPLTNDYRECSPAPSVCRSHLYHLFWLNTGQYSWQENFPVLGPKGKDLLSSLFLSPLVYPPVELQKQTNSVRSYTQTRTSTVSMFINRNVRNFDLAWSCSLLCIDLSWLVLMDQNENMWLAVVLPWLSCSCSLAGQPFIKWGSMLSCFKE